jgi:uncharacterized membrane protein
MPKSWARLLVVLIVMPVSLFLAHWVLDDQIIEWKASLIGLLFGALLILPVLALFGLVKPRG